MGQSKKPDFYFSADSRRQQWSKSNVGSKAFGLAQLSTAWVPPFFVISADIDLGNVSRSSLKVAIKRLTDGLQDPLIIRSSALEESLDDRGKYQSYRSDSAIDDVLSAATRIRRHYEESVSSHSAHNADEISVIVQRYLAPRRIGHLSNERRVSREITSWHLEYQESESQTPTVANFSTKRVRTSTDTQPLECATTRVLHDKLCEVARVFDREERRVHIEWIWDGRFLWIVQCDDEAELVSQPPGAYWLSRRKSSPLGKLELLVPVLDAKESWPKVKSVKTFEQCGMPTGDVFVLEDTRTLRSLASGRVPKKLASDLATLLSLPILIRTDIAESPSRSGMLLPRTGALSRIDDALTFLKEHSSDLIGRVGEHDFCFAFHQFIPARGGAYSYSQPGSSRVLIDATWGGPDSLHCYPHDSFQVDTEQPETISKKIRCKTNYLDMGEDGRWTEVRCGRPWDWKQSLSKEELHQIANNGRALADHLGKTIEVMYFVGALDANGQSICLPWYCTDKVATHVDSGTNVRFAGSRVTVTNIDDVRALEEQWKSELLRPPFSIRLRPQPDLLRSESLIDEVARFANAARAPIELEGSILSHCYYMLQRHGVRIASVDAFQEPALLQRFGKLVRDKIPLRIEQHGERPRTFRVTSDELLQLLKAKAIEESLEFFWETENAKLLEELADILEVVKTSAKLCGSSLEELIEIARTKYEERGGFEEGIVLLETRAVPLITRELKEAALFQEDDLPEGRQSSPKPSRYYETRMPKARGTSVVISLVPPDPKLGRNDVSVSLPDGYEAKIHYLDSEIRVNFEKRPHRLADPRQRTFSFLDNE